MTLENCKEQTPVWVLAHRGARSEGAAAGSGPAGDNTLEAFAAARRLGADGVELDVHRGADRTLVVHHDPEIPGVGPIANLDRAALPSWVPLLDAALAACAGMVVDVEVKHDPAGDPDRCCAAAVGDLLAGAAPLQAAAPGHGARPAGVLVSSFDLASLEAVKARAPRVPTGLLVGWAGDARRELEVAASHGCAALHPFVAQVDATLVEDAHRRGLAVNVWTVNADADLAAMVRLGVDAVITDRVVAALAATGRPERNGGGGAISSTIEA